MKGAATMRILISADMEGISGVCAPEQTHPGSSEYERARLLMTEEVNAAVEGALEGGASEVWVVDGHGAYRNLLIEKLHERAALVSGKPRLFGMMAGIDCGPWHGVFMIGYHARAGAAGVLAHTINGGVFAEIRVNDEPVGEYFLNGVLAGAFGAPVRLLSGDDCLAAESSIVFPSAEIVTVKRALGNRAAVHLSPAMAHQALREGAYRAMSCNVEPLILEGPFSVRIDAVRSFHADLVAMAPGVERVSPMCVGFEAETPAVMCRLLNSLSAMAASL